LGLDHCTYIDRISSTKGRITMLVIRSRSLVSLLCSSDIACYALAVLLISTGDA
jgi:hypothetical protein